MKKYYFFFIFKFRFRRAAFNNFLKLKKIKNYKIIDLSGPFKYYLLSKILIMIVQIFPKKFDNFILISCDGLPFIKINSVNIWFGGTSLKIPKEFNKYSNNLPMIKNFIVKEKNFISLYPCNLKKINFKKKFKIIYVGALKLQTSNITLKIWKKNNNAILNNLSLIDNKKFWAKNKLLQSDNIHKIYLEIKNLIRLNVIKEINKKFRDDLIVVGTDWKKHINNSVPSNYDTNYVRSLYDGNICLDFGSRWGDNSLYPRNIEIIEAGGLLLQSLTPDSTTAYGNLTNSVTFNSVNELVKKIINYKKNYNLLVFDYKKFSSLFSNSSKNYKTLTIIKNISKKNS